MHRRHNLLDHFIIQLQHSLNTIARDRYPKMRKNPGDTASDTTLHSEQQRKIAGFMRVNHSGEVCAQALYRGQQVFAKNETVKNLLAKSCEEETDHLAWCYDRLRDLKSHRSYLNIFWYWNSFVLGMIASLAGDRFSLGFVEETEKQVSEHLQSHLDQLPQEDEKTRLILQQMKIDETQHGDNAQASGAHELPSIIKFLMRCHAKVMTTLAYYF